ncbi:MAG: glycosyltransferase family 2 protein [Ginsengibacter sp.]
MKQLTPPLISCIMPTYNRRTFIPNAIRYFLRQDYPNKELIILDDGTDTILDLIPDDKEIKYIKLSKKITLGEKRNIGVSESEGDLIMHWDDDDWYSASRMEYQVKTLLTEETSICGINDLLYFDLIKKKAYRYVYPLGHKIWLAGSSMCYRKEIWQKNKFDEINIGEDGTFIWKISKDEITVLSEFKSEVHMIHRNNVSPKRTNGSWWHPISVDEIQETLGSDWDLYNNYLV